MTLLNQEPTGELFFLNKSKTKKIIRIQTPKWYNNTDGGWRRLHLNFIFFYSKIIQRFFAYKYSFYYRDFRFFLKNLD